MVSSTINEAGYCFIQAGGYIKQMRRPLFNYVMWTTWRNAIIFAHNVVIFGVVALIFQVPIGWASLLAVPGLLLLAVNLIWMELLLGVLSTRFRDIPITVQSLLSIMFFVTPIFWKPEQLGSRQWIAHYNPMTHLLDIVRLPFLDEVPSMFSYAMAGGSAVVGWSVALIFFARFRARIAYWL
jgi:lipopolysaccharide transport system permease protein